MRFAPARLMMMSESFNPSPVRFTTPTRMPAAAVVTAMLSTDREPLARAAMNFAGISAVSLRM